MKKSVTFTHPQLSSSLKKGAFIETETQEHPQPSDIKCVNTFEFLCQNFGLTHVSKHP